MIIKRISRILAALVLYVACAYSYLIAKGFIFNGETFILSNVAKAADEFSVKVTGDIGISQSRIRSLGDENAPITIFDYSTVTCAHCMDFHKFTLPKLMRDFISTGKVRFVFIHCPFDAVSMRAAKLSYCLPEDNFYKFIDDLYNSKDWLFAKDETVMYEHAKKFGMTDNDINACNDDKKLTSDILLVRDNAIKNFGISGTPSFIIEGKDGKELIIGTKSYDSLKKYLEERLKGEGNVSNS